VFYASLMALSTSAGSCWSSQGLVDSRFSIRVTVEGDTDDIVLGFQVRADPERFRDELAERLRKFWLELRPDKARLLESGAKAAEHRTRHGLGKPGTFAFLGFTHMCRKTKRGRFTVLRQTNRTRMQAKLQAVKTELWRRLHDAVPDVGAWLKTVVGGHVRYFGVPRNRSALAHFRFSVARRWHCALSRRSQRGRVPWDGMKRLIHRWLPAAQICHPYPERRLRVTT
jgi:RNA-directed DNA polymerase